MLPVRGCEPIANIDDAQPTLPRPNTSPAPLRWSEWAETVPARCSVQVVLVVGR